MALSSPVIALLSIKPQYANAILDGRKKVEFRKRVFARAVTHIVIYATAPIGRIVGWFKVGKTAEKSPAALWRSFSKVGGITAKDFNAYYKNAALGVAIGVSNPRRLPKPVAVSRVGATPPQSYAYLPPSALARIVVPKLPAKAHAARRKTMRRVQRKRR